MDTHTTPHHTPTPPHLHTSTHIHTHMHARTHMHTRTPTLQLRPYGIDVLVFFPSPVASRYDDMRGMPDLNSSCQLPGHPKQSYI